MQTHEYDTMFDYDKNLEDIFSGIGGEKRNDRTGTGTFCRFGNNIMTFSDIWERFPLVTAKSLAVKTTFEELNWFLRGETTLSTLYKGAQPWWADFSKKTDPENFDYLGPIYGKQWRKWQAPDGTEIDQIANVIDQIKNNPFSRRHIVSAWNAADIDSMGLPPCHVLFQFYVSSDRKYLDCQLYQRSGDMFLGVPVNIASYSMLMHLVGAATDLIPRDFYHVIADAHIYLDHMDAVEEYLNRVFASQNSRELVTFRISDEGIALAKQDISLVAWEHITISNYNPMSPIKAKMSV